MRAAAPCQPLRPAARPGTARETASDVLQERDRRRAQTQGGDIFNYGTGNPSADRW